MTTAGHAQPRPRPLDIVPTCSSFAPERRACPPEPPPPTGHAQSWPRPLDNANMPILGLWRSPARRRPARQAAPACQYGQAQHADAPRRTQQEARPSARQHPKRLTGPTALAALAGVAAAAVVLSVAELIGAFFTARATPLIALGSTFIDFTPSWLKDFAIATFGTNDKARPVRRHGGDHPAARLRAGRCGLPQVGPRRRRRAADGRRDRRQRGDPGQREAAGCRFPR